MAYFIGGLVGVVILLLIQYLVDILTPPRKREVTSVETAILELWRQNVAAQQEENSHLSRIADAVTTWEQRYTRRVKKATKAEE